MKNSAFSSFLEFLENQSQKKIIINELKLSKYKWRQIGPRFGDKGGRLHSLRYTCGAYIRLTYEQRQSGQVCRENERLGVREREGKIGATLDSFA